jgi:flavin-dependent dehydrogenase
MKTDVAIVGGGPAGSASAMFLADKGIKSVVIEKETFPRYRIGESMTGECGAVVRSLGLEEKMLEHEFPIKTGLTVYGTGGKNAWFVPVMGRDAAWNLFDQFTWQVRRSDFDKMMLDEAVAREADLIQGQAIEPLFKDDGSVRGVRVQMADGDVKDIESEVLLDCSGQTTFLSNAGVTGPKYRGNYDRQIAVFSQVAGAIRDGGKHRNDTLIFYRQKYHWAWYIPLDDDVISVGVVIPATYFTGKKERKRDFLLRELRELNPELKSRLPEIELVEDVRSVVNYSYQVRQFCGKGFICIGDAHRFIDPIFSFGLFETMKEAQLMAPIVKAYLNGAHRDDPNPFAEHQRLCDQALDIQEDAVDTFWEHPLAFALFAHKRYSDQIIDILSGRVFERQPSGVVAAMRELLGRDRSRDDHWSLPMGSRYHQERADLWDEE